MDDKTFVASYVAQETTRINERLKEMIARGEMPSDEEKDALMNDMETTLSRLQGALAQLHRMMAEDGMLDGEDENEMEYEESENA